MAYRVGVLCSRSRRAAVTLLAACALLPPGGKGRADDEPVPSIEDVRLHVEETLGSLLQLEVKFRQNQSPTPPDDPAYRGVIDILPASIEYEQDFEWWMDRRKRAYRTKPRPFLTSDRLDYQHFAFDGKRTHHAVYDDGDLSLVKLFRAPDLDKRLKDWFPDSWIGIRMYGSEASLIDLLRHSDTVVSGREMIDGMDCVKVHVPTARLWGGTPGSWDVWISPDHDWLPTRMALMMVLRGSDDKVRTIHKRVGVSKFSRLSDGLTGEERWFPQTAYIVDLLRLDISVLEVGINQPIAAETFVIDPEAGTEIQETDKAGHTTIRVHTGSKSLVQVRRDVAADALVEAAKRPTDLVDASPQRTGLAFYSWLLTALLIGAAVFLGVLSRRA